MQFGYTTMNYPSFIDNSTYIALDGSRDEVAQLQAMLSNLTRVHLLAAIKFDNFDALIKEYLMSGREIFGLETGIISKIDGNQYKICDVLSPLDALAKDQMFNLEDTYCREVVRNQKVIGLPEIGKLDFMKYHPVYINLKLEAYLSAPIFVNDTLFGTLNFTSTKPRKHGFSRHEHNLILLLANSIGAYILLREKESALIELNRRIKRFVGYVAHDLRNPLGAIISISTIAIRRMATDDHANDYLQRIQGLANTSLEFVSSILESAALSEGKLEVQQERFSIAQLLKESKDAVFNFNDHIEQRIDTQCNPQLEGVGDFTRLKQCVVNFLINALKYSPTDSVIQLIAVKNELLTISVVNVIGENREDHSNIYDSVGFGLDIARDILDAHNTRLTISTKANEYCAAFTLPIA